MAEPKSFSEQIRSTDAGEKAWQQERAIFEATERICELLDKQKVSRSDLAAKLGKTKGFVSQLLDGTANMTIRTLSDIFVSLGRAVHITDGALDAPEATLATETTGNSISIRTTWESDFGLANAVLVPAVQPIVVQRRRT